jgi:dihydrofolate synthase / folylpolyglutamate synthase
MKPSPASSSLSPSFSSLLAQLPMGRIRLGTETMLQCLELLGHPQELIPAIHVAGTNGKGSVSHMLVCGLGSQGVNVGSMHSPHLRHPSERICINGKPLSQEAFEQYGHALWKRLIQFFGPFQPEQAEHSEWPTYFECLTLLGFYVFRELNVDVMVIETGLGGRLDATNVLSQPVVTAITSIGYDHMDRLGHTLEAIAAEKAGIFRANVPVVLGPNIPEEARQVLLASALACRAEPVMETGADMLHVEQACTSAHRQRIRNLASGDTLELGLLGGYQRLNLATVLGIADVLHRCGIIADMNAFIQALSTVRWPGRFDYLPQHRMLLEGAHNAEGFQALKQGLEECFPQAGLYWCIALQAHRDPGLIMERLKQLASRSYGILVTQASGTSTGTYHNPQRLRQILRDSLPQLRTVPIWAATDVPTAHWMLSRLLKGHCASQHPEALGIATGSLYPLGEWLDVLDPLP